MNKIRGEVLREYLTKDGSTLVKHDRKIGYADGYFHNTIRRNQLNNVGLRYVLSLGINLADIIEDNEIVEDEIYIDKEVLEDFAKKHNISIYMLSKSIGRGKNFLSEHIRLNTPIRKGDYLAVQALYGIDIRKPTPKQEKDENEANNEDSANNITQGILSAKSAKPQARKLIINDMRNIGELNANELEKLIYRATYAAIINANRVINQ